MQVPSTVPVATSRAANRVVVRHTVCHRAGTALLERQARLGAVERLDLRLFINRQNQGFVRRIKIEADHVLDLLDKVLVSGELERLDQVRLEAVGVPDPLHAGVGQACDSGHGAHAPLRRSRRLLMQGHVDHPLDHRSRQGLTPWRARGVLEKPFDAGLRIAAAPAPHRQSARANADRHLGGAQALARQQNNPSPPDNLLGRVAVPDQALQAIPISGGNLNAFDLAHPSNIARRTRFRNRSSVTEH
jgi:hypothetical protein